LNTVASESDLVTVDHVVFASESDFLVLFDVASGLSIGTVETVDVEGSSVVEGGVDFGDGELDFGGDLGVRKHERLHDGGVSEFLGVGEPVGELDIQGLVSFSGIFSVLVLPSGDLVLLLEGDFQIGVQSFSVRVPHSVGGVFHFSGESELAVVLISGGGTGSSTCLESIRSG